jgi:hypothetical protein
MSEGKTVLTDATVVKLRPAHEQREIPDAGCPGLYLTIEPSGRSASLSSDGPSTCSD